MLVAWLVLWSNDVVSFWGMWVLCENMEVVLRGLGVWLAGCLESLAWIRRVIDD